MKPTLVYCYDAYCSWCYGFSEVLKKLNSDFKNQVESEVLSGGMILPQEPVQIGAIAGYVKSTYRNVEELTGIKFGEDYLWHIKNPEQSDWYPNSEKPAIALCIFKEYYPDQQISFAADLQYALYFEGRDLTDNEAYRHLLEKYNLPSEEFYEKLTEQYYTDQAYDEFEVCRELQVTGFPVLLLQLSENRFHLLAKGFTDYDTLNLRMLNLLKEIK